MSEPMPIQPAPEKINVLQFMLLRASGAVDPAAKRGFVYDDEILYEDARGGTASRREVDLFGAASPSAIGKLVYQKVFCEPLPPSVIQTPAGVRTVSTALFNTAFVPAVLRLLPAYSPVCPQGGTPAGTLPLNLIEIERHAFVLSQDRYYVLPDSLPYWTGFPFQAVFPALLDVFQRNRRSFNLGQMWGEVEGVFGRAPHTVVFAGRRYSTDFARAKRSLFDTLYLLYVLRRATTVSLENVIDALRALHALEALAIDRFVEILRRRGKAPAANSDEGQLWATLQDLYPQFKGWDFAAPVAGFPQIASQADLDAHFEALPVVHPIFARLYNYKKPFNDLKPIGVGDLKVVKKWLIDYHAGEVAHIENVLMGETKARTHRSLEKTESVFSYTSDTDTETTKDTQTTERGELKREIDSVVATNLSVNANLSVTYTYGPIVAAASGGMAYSRNSTDSTKAASNYSREVVDKAVQRVQSRVTQSRSSTLQSETEETNVHSLSGVGASTHITGVYRWVDKRYRAQLFNYGKRMMFEFVIPEPAAFFVDARLKAYAASLNLPSPPVSFRPEAVVMPATVRMPASGKTAAQLATAFTESQFNALRALFDLDDLPYPSLKKKLLFIDRTTGRGFFHESGLENDQLSAFSYVCHLDAVGYQLDSLAVEGDAYFQGKAQGRVGDETTDGVNNNRLVIRLDDQIIARHADNHYEVWAFDPPYGFTEGRGHLIDKADVNLTIGLWDGSHFSLTIIGEFTLSDAAFADFQTRVYLRVSQALQKAVDERNALGQQAHDEAMAAYRNRMDAIKALAIHDLIQGQSEAFNQAIIQTELKKHCLSQITKDFDADTTDDLLTAWDPVVEKPVKFEFTRPNLDETAQPPTFSFKTDLIDGTYPALDLSIARAKGRYVQFLEQAFEWAQVSYLFYPYFWGAAPDWINLLSRSDDTDPTFSAFLQAGSCRVLVPVTPAYETAVTHFLATREPWDGGPAPAIGDPLFIPLYEELRKQQDDLEGAVPEGHSWTFTMPTSLVYLENGSSPLPTFPDPAP